jgi:hypothetical protein
VDVQVYGWFQVREACKRDWRVAWRAENRQRLLEYGKAWNAAHPEKVRERKTRHRRNHPLYNTWTNMVMRCTNPNSTRWNTYGGANPPVTVCDRWLESFKNFTDDMGTTKPEGTSLGRWGDVGPYSKENCSWQTPAQQGLEKRIHILNKKLIQIHNSLLAIAA